jgi:ATP-dependent Clp protease ATP-binding subunit ClpA/ActR/RegA family two-component response regulator
MIEETVLNSISPDGVEAVAETSDLVALLSRKVVGQTAATSAIVPYVYMYQSGLAPEGRPAGVFLLLGPTGTGKTKTVEAIADLIHGSEKKVLKIDCGEFQMEHETARLIGAPPGYLGHGETTPLLNQQQLVDVTSHNSDLALVLFDEIEKAAPSVTKLLLGILDKGILRLGDNSTVNFEKSLIFFTSNLGARQMMEEINPSIGFATNSKRTRSELNGKLEEIALSAVRKRFSPEFVNRIDAVVTYSPLDQEAIATILDHDIRALQEHVNSRLGESNFAIDLLPESRNFLLSKGISQEYGARELKRTIHRELTQPLATMVARGEIRPGSHVTVNVDKSGQGLAMEVSGGYEETQVRKKPSILIVDDNRDLLMFLAGELRQVGWDIVTAESGTQARYLFRKVRPQAVILDYMLGDDDDDGLSLGCEFQDQRAAAQIIIMTGGGLTESQESLCKARDLPVLYKPFLAQEILNFLKLRLSKTARY